MDNNFGQMFLLGLDALANKPQKTSQRTTTTTVPLEREDMRMRRDTIGQSRQALSDYLQNRETRGYTFGNALANLGGQTLPGQIDWLGGLRAFGGAYTGPTNAAIDRLKQDYDMSRSDLADALMYDKAMGEHQVTDTDIGYDGGGAARAGLGMGQKQAQYETTNENLADIYQTLVENPITFSTVGKMKLDEDSRALIKAVEGRGIETLGHNEFAYLASIMPSGFASAINTAKEQEMMRPYTTQFSEGTGSAKKAAIKNMVSSIYDAYANEAKQQGFKMPITREEYINSRLEGGRAYNPKFFTGASTEMYMPKKQAASSSAGNALKQGAAAAADRVSAFMKGTV